MVAAVALVSALTVWFAGGPGTALWAQGSDGAPSGGFMATAAEMVGEKSRANASQAEDPVEIPLRVAGGRLLVPVDAGVGHAVDFVLTTGSAVTVLTETAAKHLGDDPRLTLGGLPVPMESFATVPDAQLAVEGAMVGGMISANMLNQFDVLLDAPAGRLVLKAPGREVSWQGVALSEPVRVRVYHGILMSFDVDLDGERYPAALDLGTPMVVINRGVQDELGLDDEDVAVLTLGDTSHPDLPVRMLELEVLRRFDPADEGFVLVGAPLAYDCPIALSWVHREIRTCAR